MLTEDTIAAVSTSLAHGAIGIVRLSGKDSIKITDKFFSSPKKKSLKKTPSHRIIYGYIINSKKEIIDEVLVSVMKAPHTYTREDVVEINCHGGPVPLKKILELLLTAGARLAEPGEFTQRAFVNGRIDLARAEAVLDIINALTDQSREAAVEQLSGKLSDKINILRTKLIGLTALVEAHIDFPEEDLGPMSLSEIGKKAQDIQKSLKNMIENSQYGVILRQGLKAAIIGRPNVGKSSLLNALLKQDRAIVTEIPGTTRDVIEEHLNIHGFPVKIMDTAGIREVKDIAEKEGVRRSLKAMTEADLVLVILDGSEGLHKTDMELIRKSDPKVTILVINKTDLPQKIKFKKENRTIVNISALKEQGLDKLRETIAETALNGKPLGSADLVTNVRHVHALQKALKSMNAFTKGFKKLSPEFMAVELRDALDAIGEILGFTATEEILDKIFSDFCIGK